MWKPEPYKNAVHFPHVNPNTLYFIQLSPLPLIVKLSHNKYQSFYAKLRIVHALKTGEFCNDNN